MYIQKLNSIYNNLRYFGSYNLKVLISHNYILVLFYAIVKEMAVSNQPIAITRHLHNNTMFMLIRKTPNKLNMHTAFCS